MFRLSSDLKVFIHGEPVDFPLNINGLTLLVEQTLKLDPFAVATYIVRNRRTDRIKILGWQRNGFWLLQKRLEADRFVWLKTDLGDSFMPKSTSATVIPVTNDQSVNLNTIANFRIQPALKANDLPIGLY